MRASFRKGTLIQNVMVSSLIVAVTVGIVVTWDSMQTRVFAAQSSISIDNGAFRGEGAERIVGTTYTVQRMPMYLLLADSPETLQSVIDELNLQSGVDELASRVSFAPSNGNLVIDVSVRDQDPELAAVLADAIALQLARSIENEERASALDSDNIEVLQIESASVPTNPIIPRTGTNVLLAFFFGIILSIVFWAFRDRFDSKIRSVEALQAVSGVNNLGQFTFNPAAEAESPITLKLDSESAEAFRSIRTNLKFIDPGNSTELITVTSPTYGVGKESAALNIAVAFAQVGNRVALVEADMRRPWMQSKLHLGVEVGLSDVLNRRVPLETALVPWYDGKVTILPAGQRPNNPSELLLSSDFAELIVSLKREFSIIILDATPMDSFTDGVIASALADKVVLVVGLDVSRQKEVAETMSALNQVRAGVLGTILSLSKKVRRNPHA